MSTAIVTIHTEEGFVIAADGRRKQGARLITDSEQKFFPVQRKWDTLAYALAGITTLYEDERFESLVFDFREAARSSFTALSKVHPANFALFAERLSRRINKSLKKLSKDNPEVKYPNPDGKGTIAHLMLAGYYDRLPAMARIRFFHRNQKLVKNPEVNSYRPVGTRWEISMPDKVGYALLKAEDSRLAHCYKPSLRKLAVEEPLSLLEAQEAATTCIMACGDPTAFEIDPNCHTVGGHLHIASITEAQGFHWVTPPI